MLTVIPNPAPARAPKPTKEQLEAGFDRYPVKVVGTGYAPNESIVVVLVCHRHIDWVSGKSDEKGSFELPLHYEAQGLDSGHYSVAAFEGAAEGVHAHFVEAIELTVA